MFRNPKRVSKHAANQNKNALAETYSSILNSHNSLVLKKFFFSYDFKLLKKDEV